MIAMILGSRRLRIPQVVTQHRIEACLLIDWGCDVRPFAFNRN